MRQLSAYVTAIMMVAAGISPSQGWTAPGEARKTQGAPSAEPSKEDALATGNFEQKLNEMLSRTEKSIKLVRDQIVESQTAPFLPELFLQLADLLTQKSSTLYYIQMERQKNTDTSVGGDKAFSPVVVAQKEAVAVYKTLLKDFPKFEKRDQVLFRLALALKSIDETAQFIAISSKLLKAYPSSEEAMRVRLLLGQHFFDAGDFDQSYSILQPVTRLKTAYERNVAQYRIGLIYIAKGRFADALKQFEMVVLDPDLKEQDNPYNITAENQGNSKTDLKREALIDSIRAYTHVYKKDPDPSTYYSRLAPTEVHFQEVAEKLALRYINMKQYPHAVKLLRALSERTVDPQKVMNIYQEVLLMIPIQNRIEIPVEEMRFLLEKYNLWLSYYDIPRKTLDASFKFFEKQVRDLATTSHTVAKRMKGDRERHYLERARVYYELYLGFFRETANGVKMATNLADVHYRLRDYHLAGDHYLRVYLGEYGKPSKSQLKLLIENAILCLQKPAKYDFYEGLRMRGLLIKAIDEYLKVDPRKKKDPRIRFAMLKAEYEQGFFPEVLDGLYEYMKDFKRTRQARDAGDMILDYFNTRNEFGGLETWSSKILALKLPNRAYNRKVATLKAQARNKVLQEKVKSIAGYDDFEQGKSYLTAALSSEGELAEEALQQALARSKKERDIETFLKAAQITANKETSQKKKAAIIRSVAREYMKTGSYYRGLEVLDGVTGDQNYPQDERTSALEEAIATALVLRDWQRLEKYLAQPGWQAVSGATKGRLRDQITDLIDSGIEVSQPLLSTLLALGVTDETLLTLFKAQFRVGGEIRNRILAEVRGRCGREGRQVVCRWGQLDRMDALISALNTSISAATPDLQGIEALAPQFMELTAQLQSLEGSGEATFEIAVAQRNHEAYRAFAGFLAKGARANADLAPVLQQKSQETLGTAALYIDRCKAVARQSGSRPELCRPGAISSLKDLLDRSVARAPAAPGKDPSGGPILDLQKTIFAAKDPSQPTFELAVKYLEDGHIHHAAATASYGASGSKARQADFMAVLGCSVLKLGLQREAQYHLKRASGIDGLKEKCMAEAGMGRKR